MDLSDASDASTNGPGGMASYLGGRAVNRIVTKLQGADAQEALTEGVDEAVEESISSIDWDGIIDEGMEAAEGYDAEFSLEFDE